jgi:hypothetical protein
MRAGQYARDCYGTRSVTSPGRCNFFATQSIPYPEPELEQTCPFRDTTLCAGGDTTAVKFSTGLVDASILGFNSDTTPKFKRTTICVPLNLNQGFVDIEPPSPHHSVTRYVYNLGPVNDSEQYSSNYTFTLFGDSFKWGISAYSVR